MTKGLAGISILAFLWAMPGYAGFQLPKNPLTQDQTDCMKNALGKNFKPSAKQLADAAKTCAAPKAKAKPSQAQPPAATAKPASKPADSEDSD